MKNIFSKRILSIDASGTRKMFEIGNGMKNPIDLTVGQADFPVPEEVKKVAIEAIENDKNKYTVTLGILELREAIAKKLKEKNGINVSAENIMITSAVSGGLTLLFLALFETGDEVILTDPYFVSYKHLITLSGAKAVMVDTYPDFILKPELLEKAITDKTKAIIINSPANPTGKIYSKKEIEDIVKIAKSHNLFIISDEIYEEFSYDGKSISPASFYEKTIILGGFSKSHAMMGWRVGYLVAPVDIMNQLIKIQQYTFVCAPTPFQYASVKALEVSTNKEVERYKRNRDMVVSELSDLYEFQKPEGAFYVFIKYPYDPDLFMKKCIERKLLVVPGNVFSEKNTHFRISFAVSQDVLKKGISILQELVK